MNNPHIEHLENTISTYINTVYKDIPPTDEEFQEKACLLRKNNEGLMQVSDEEFEAILSRLRQNLVIRMDVGVYINDRASGHQSWLPAKRAEIDFFFWNRYKKYLEAVKHWNPRLTMNLGKVSDEILDLCGDPAEEHFAVKGLVLGDVQSGKTANYTALCNKAADAGYRIIIVLAGMQENLRKQTQERLDAEFSGRRSEYYLNPRAEQGIKNQAFGVGRYGTANKIASFTSVTKDFDRGVLRSNGLGVENVNCPVLLVVKKNKGILNNLIQWLSDNNSHNAAGQIDLPLLLIDDEADNASVNTKDEDAAPAAINDCIRRLLLLFSKTTYLGITATPFANIFIDPGNDDDLFPSDFIYALSAPTNYIGADRIFGDYGDAASVLVQIDTPELEKRIPAKHKKEFTVSELPADLYEAVDYFLLVNAIRDQRGDAGTHRSMMVHISRYTAVQDQIAVILGLRLEQVKSDLRNYAGWKDEQAEKIPSIAALHSVWEKFLLGGVSGLTWTQMRREYLYKAAEPIDVKAINMRTGAASLDYSRHQKDGLRVIAVGGNSLSRGLTLEGLCVSYFYRSTRMYDTLLQMGRWFGYRPNYDDLVKVWLSGEAMDWYGQITNAAAELKNEIIKMRNAHRTPREFGLRVRQDPGALIVTARNKMRTATELRCPVSVSGHLLETPRLQALKKVLAENEKRFRQFVDGLAKCGSRLTDKERTQGNFYWEHVPADYIARLLMDFDTHLWHLSFNGAALSSFIDAHSWPRGWDVVLLCHGSGAPYPGGLRCGNEVLQIHRTEKRNVVVDQTMISISGTKVRVGSGGCTRIGLTSAQIKAAQDAFVHETKKKHVPDSAYLIRDRAPILMLHIIQADYADIQDKENWPPFLFALGVGFPEDDYGAQTAVYKVNLIELKNWSQISDDEEDEDEDIN